MCSMLRIDYSHYLKNIWFPKSAIFAIFGLALMKTDGKQMNDDALSQNFVDSSLEKCSLLTQLLRKDDYFSKALYSYYCQCLSN